jgi:hypothetical protein
VAPARWHGVDEGGVEGEWQRRHRRIAAPVSESKRSTVDVGLEAGVSSFVYIDPLLYIRSNGCEIVF